MYKYTIQQNKQLTTTLTYKHTDKLKTHTHTQNQKGEKNNTECAHVEKRNKSIKFKNKQTKKC